MARNYDALLNGNLDSNCTESFQDDVDIVVERRVNFILQKAKFNTNNQRIQHEINKAEDNLNNLTSKDNNVLRLIDFGLGNGSTAYRRCL